MGSPLNPLMKSWDCVAAIRRGDVPEVKRLLKEGVDLSYIAKLNESSTNMSPLNLPAYYNTLNFPMAIVCSRNHESVEILSLLLSHGMDMGKGVEYPISQLDDHMLYRSPLHIAVQENQWAKAELLLEYGQDYRIPDPATNLHPGVVAFQAGQVELATRMSLAPILKKKVDLGLNFDDMEIHP